jgi:DNA primase
MGARIAKRSKQLIIERVDMAQVVGETVRLRRNGTALIGLCPFHEEKTPSFNVNKHNKVFYCHGCGAGGDVISFVRELHGFSYVESLEHLAERAGVEIEYEQADPKQMERDRAQRSQRRRLLDLNETAQRFFVSQLHGPAGSVARQYLEGRGLSRETAERFGLGCAPDSWDALALHLVAKGFDDTELQLVGLASPRRTGQGLYDRFRNRLMFPVYSTAGDLVAFGGRALGDDPRAAKYMNSPESELSDSGTGFNSGLSSFYKKGRIVFGLWQARTGVRQQKSALIVEGNLDVMMLHQVGLTHAVCLMGTAVTPAQIKEISRFTDKVALVFDGDSAGRKAARKVVPICIEAGMGGVFVNLPQGEDPDSYVRSEGVAAFKLMVERAAPLVTGYIEAAVAEHDGTILGKRTAIADVQNVLARIADPIVREMARTHLAHQLGIEPSDLNRYVRHLKVDYRGPAPDGGANRPQEMAEEPLSQLELDLVRILAKLPKYLTYVVDQGCIADVEHVGLYEALRFLADRARAEDGVRAEDGAGTATTVKDLSGWLHELSDGRPRRAFLQAMIESDRVSDDASEHTLKLILDRLEAKSLQPQLDELTQRLMRAAKASDKHLELVEMAREQQRMTARIVELQQAMATAAHGATVEQL